MAFLTSFWLLLPLSQNPCAGPPYAEAVALYRGGDYAAAVDALAEGNVLVDIASDTQPPPNDGCLVALGLIETELGMRHAWASRWTAARDRLASGRRSLEAIRDAELRKRLERNWLLVVGLHYQDILLSVDPSEGLRGAEARLSQAVERFPEDPTVLLAAGAFLEWTSSVELQNMAKQAEALLAKALRLDPELTEARIRLGWLDLTQLERPEEAAPLFEKALETASDPILIYRAQMGLGRLEERAGRFAAAAEHYGAAIRAEPSWQVGHVAQAYALHRHGERARARQVLRDAARLSPPRDGLGWLAYELGSIDEREELLAQMRAEASR